MYCPTPLSLSKQRDRQHWSGTAQGFPWYGSHLMLIMVAHVRHPCGWVCKYHTTCQRVTQQDLISGRAQPLQLQNTPPHTMHPWFVLKVFSITQKAVLRPAL